MSTCAMTPSSCTRVTRPVKRLRALESRSVGSPGARARSTAFAASAVLGLLGLGRLVGLAALVLGGLVAALLFTFFVRQRIALGDEARANSMMAKAVAVVSVLLWSGVGIMGRGIGFY